MAPWSLDHAGLEAVPAFCRLSNARTSNVLRLHPCLCKLIVELRASTMDDDGKKPKVLEETEGGNQILEVLGDHFAPDLDNGERPHR